MQSIVEFIGSPWFQVPFQLAMCWVYYLLGRRAERIKFAYAFSVQDAYVKALEEQVTTGKTHVENLQVRLAELK